jgi:hypothetical protein
LLEALGSDAREVMTLSDLGDLGDFLGGVGVIVTLIYLAIQIRRNTFAVRSTSLDSAYAAHMEFQRTVWSDPELNKLWFDGLQGKREVSDTERERFLVMLISCSRLWEGADFKANEGWSLESKAWAGLNEELTGVFAFSGVQPYWTRVVRGMCAKEFVEFVESAVRERGASGNVAA